MDWALEGMVSWFSEGVEYVLHVISFMFTDILGISLDEFEKYFPAVETTYEVILVMGMSLLLLIFVFQLVRSMLGPLSESESPMKLLVKTIMFGVLLYYSKEICQVALSICLPHEDFEGFIHLINTSITYGGIESGATLGMDSWQEVEVINNTVLGDIVAGTAGGSLGTFMILANTVLLLIIAWNYFKVCFEVVERYVLFGIMTYLSPLAFATGGSGSTSNIFKAWVRMFGSQLILLLMNVWFLRVFVHGLTRAMANWQGGGTDWFITLFMAIAWLRICMHLDGHLSSLGLNVAQTGAGLGAEVFASIHMAANTGRAIVGGAGAVFKNGKGYGGQNGGFSKGPQGPTTLDTFRPRSAILDGNVSGADKRAGMGGLLGAAQRAGGKALGLFGLEVGERQLGMLVNGGLGSSARIAGGIADKSLKNLIPDFKGMDRNISSTQIASGAISTSMSFNGKKADVSMSKQRPRSGDYASISDAFGNRWYAQATGDGAGSFYSAYGKDITSLANADPKRRYDTLSGAEADRGMQSFMPVDGHHYAGTVVSAGSISTNLVSDSDPKLSKAITMSRADLVGSEEYVKAGNYEGYALDGSMWYMSSDLQLGQAATQLINNPEIEGRMTQSDTFEYGKVPSFSTFSGDIQSFIPYVGDNESSYPLESGNASMLTSINEDGTTSTWRAYTDESRVPEGASYITSEDGQSYYSLNAKYSLEPQDYGFSANIPLQFDQADNMILDQDTAYPVFQAKDYDGTHSMWFDTRDVSAAEGSIIALREDGSKYFSKEYRMVDAPAGMEFTFSDHDKEIYGELDGVRSTWIREEEHLIPDDANVVHDIHGQTWYERDVHADTNVVSFDMESYHYETAETEKTLESVQRYEDRIEIRHDEHSGTIMYEDVNLGKSQEFVNNTLLGEGNETKEIEEVTPILSKKKKK